MFAVGRKGLENHIVVNHTANELLMSVVDLLADNRWQNSPRIDPCICTYVAAGIFRHVITKCINM